MHNKSATALVAMILSVGGWFLWNIILASTYTDNVIYFVRDAFFNRFGRNITWWLCLILIVAAISVFELGVSALRAAYLPSDVDTFQALEHDPASRRRFEEASAAELQNGWTMPRESGWSLGNFPFLSWIVGLVQERYPSLASKRSKRTSHLSGFSKRSGGKDTTAIELEKRTHKDSGEDPRQDDDGENDREREIREMLERRAEEGNSYNFGRRRSSGGGITAGTKTPTRRSTEIAEMFRRGFGAVREE
jgi:hypothetical protein